MLTPVKSTLFVTTLTTPQPDVLLDQNIVYPSEGCNDTPFRADGRCSVKPPITKFLERICRKPNYLLGGFRQRELLGTQLEPGIQVFFR